MIRDPRQPVLPRVATYLAVTVCSVLLGLAVVLVLS